MASKKDFSTDATSVFVDKMVAPPKQAEAAPKKPAKKPAQRRTNAAQTEVKVTFMLHDDMDAKMRYICYAERMKQKDVIDAALRAYVADYESKHGRIK